MAPKYGAQLRCVRMAQGDCSMTDETFVDTKSLEWVASPYPGAFRKPSRLEEDGPRTTLLKMAPSQPCKWQAAQ